MYSYYDRNCRCKIFSRIIIDINTYIYLDSQRGDLQRPIVLICDFTQCIQKLIHHQLHHDHGHDHHHHCHPRPYSEHHGRGRLYRTFFPVRARNHFFDAFYDTDNSKKENIKKYEKFRWCTQFSLWDFKIWHFSHFFYNIGM